MAAKKEAESGKVTFSKEKLLKMERYGNRADLLSALLDDGVQYSIAEADKAIDNFMKGKVK